jgi:two-component system NtrC family sensor kinase
LRTRIGTQIILGVAVVMALVIGLMTTVVVRAHRADLMSQLARSVDQLSETIKSSTRDYMLENHRDRLQAQIDAIGRQPGIERVRIFNKEGKLTFSSDHAEIGQVLDTRAEACFACHAAGRALERPPTETRMRIFRDGSGGRVMGVVSSIHNREACSNASCHAHPAASIVLGVIDVNVPLAEVDAQIAGSRSRMIALAVLAIAASSAILWWLNRRLVVRPVAMLAAGTQRVADGDLTTTIPVTATHELGDLARAFNTMTRRLLEMQRQVAQADKLASVGRLAAGVAHEINNPLTGVLTYASFQADRAPQESELKRDLDVVVRETKRCREIVRGLLDFARQTPPRRQPTDVNDIARRSVAVVMNQLSLSHIAVALDLSPELPSVPADTNQMQQVVVNLLLNAADASGSGGTIRIATRRTMLPPSGNEPIRAAACPKGCDLLDPETRLGGLPTVRVLRACGGKERPLHLDPIYGRSGHLAAEQCEDGLMASYACPRCRTSLAEPGRACGRCGAPAYAVRGHDGEPIEFCSRNGCHWTRWEARDRRGPQPVVELSVEDTGAGIAPEAMARLFEPFFSTKNGRGTGLGLAVTWGIVESHGGTIAVQSDLGRGSRFTVRLPLQRAEAAAPASAGTAAGAAA